MPERYSQSSIQGVGYGPSHQEQDRVAAARDAVRAAYEAGQIDFDTFTACTDRLKFTRSQYAGCRYKMPLGGQLPMAGGQLGSDFEKLYGQTYQQFLAGQGRPIAPGDDARPDHIAEEK